MTRRRRNSTSGELVTIYWRDIPAQVSGRLGSDRQKALLTPRFQDAIDRSATVAGLTNAHDYVAEWHRTTKAVDGELESEVSTEAQRLEDEYPTERLRQLIRRGGHETGPELKQAAPSSSSLGDG